MFYQPAINYRWENAKLFKTVQKRPYPADGNTSSKMQVTVPATF